MEGNHSVFKELAYRVKGLRTATVVVSVVTVLLCAVVGVGAWVLLAGVEENAEILAEMHTLERLQEPKGIQQPLQAIHKSAPLNKAERVHVNVQEMDFAAGRQQQQQAQEKPVVELELELVPPHADSPLGMQVIEEEEVVVMQPKHKEFLQNFLNLTTRMAEDIQEQGLFETLAGRTSEKYMRETFEILSDYTSQVMDENNAEPRREKRSIAAFGMSVAGRALAYVNYASFGKFMARQVSAIAEDNFSARQASRKLSGDAPQIGDSSFWSNKQDKPQRQRPLTAATDNWEPQVNKVSLEFIGEILNTLLNMMKEYLMKDNVMECLWYMFCGDLNHQARYSDVYGLMARVNSVGLKVLVAKDARTMDTLGEIWRALTAWESLQCDAMFPQCDGPKALEIVNEVAVGDGFF